MSPRDYVVADVFTDVPLHGNPVAVFLDGSGLDTELMQRTARELNLSETVFVLPPGDDAAATPIRIFTPQAELPFAGHPVLGTAFVLAEGSDADVVRLEPPVGAVPVTLRREDGRLTYGEMEQPIPRSVPFDREEELLEALGIERADTAPAAYTNGPTFVYVGLGSEAALGSLRPDYNALADLGELGVSCFAGTPPTVRTRVFAPALGVPEDPATGSAAGPLGVHLLRAGRLTPGELLELRQGEEIGRPSVLHVRIEGTADRVERVAVGGCAVIVARGRFWLQ